MYRSLIFTFVSFTVFSAAGHTFGKLAALLPIAAHFDDLQDEINNHESDFFLILKRPTFDQDESGILCCRAESQRMGFPVVSLLLARFVIIQTV